MPRHPKAKESARPPHATWHDMHVMAVWDQKYAELVVFKERFGHCIVPQHWEENSKLGLWVRDQRVLKKQEKLPAEKVSLLDKIGFIWVAKPTRNPHAKWEERYAELVKFKAKFGHTNVPANSIKYSTLARWVSNQRTLQKNSQLHKWKKELLEKIGFQWGKKVRTPRTFDEYVVDLVRFKKIHGHCWVSMGDSVWKDLARWMAATRAKKLAGQLPFDGFSQLAALGVAWVKGGEINDISSNWGRMLRLLKSHKEKYGDCDFQKHPANSEDLDSWAKEQRQKMAAGMLSTECQIQLNKITFAWVYDQKELRAMFNDKFHSKAKTRPASLVPALDQYAQKKKRAEAVWDIRFGELYAYRKKHGSLTSLSKDPVARELLKWFQRQNILFRQDALDKQKVQTLREFGFLSTLPSSGRGGKRPGSGRKKGTGIGRKAITRSVSLLPETWERIDAMRGTKSRGKFVESLLIGLGRSDGELGARGRL